MVLSGANAAIFVAEVNLNIPICKYEEDHQCRFDCPIFGVCEKNPC